MSKSPMKFRDIEKMVRSTVCIDTPPEGRVAYSLVEKQSKSGIFNNQRFLMLNWRDAQLLYFDYIPSMPIPVTSLDQIPKPKPKNTVAFKDMTYERPKDGLKNRLKITLPADPKGKQVQWLFIMNNKMVDLWMEQLDKFKAEQPKNQEGKKPQEQANKSEEIKELKGPGQQPVTPIAKLDQQTFHKQPKVEQGSTAQQNVQNVPNNPQNMSNVQSPKNPQSQQNPQNRQNFQVAPSVPPHPQSQYYQQNQPEKTNQLLKPSNPVAPYNHPSTAQNRQPLPSNREQPNVNQQGPQPTAPAPSTNPTPPTQPSKSLYEPPNPRGVSFSANQPPQNTQPVINQPPPIAQQTPVSQQPINQPNPNQMPVSSSPYDQITNSNIQPPIIQSRLSQPSNTVQQSQINIPNNTFPKTPIENSQSRQSNYQQNIQQGKTEQAITPQINQINQPKRQTIQEPTNNLQQPYQPRTQSNSFAVQATQPYPNQQAQPIQSSKYPASNEPKIFNSHIDPSQQPQQSRNFSNQLKQQPYVEQSSRYSKQQLSKSKVQQPEDRPYAETPLSQPRRNPLTYDPPDTYRSDDTYMREQQDQDKWNEMNNRQEQQKNFPYRVEQERMPVASTFKREPANPVPEYQATGEDNYRNVGHRKPVEEQQYRPNVYQEPVDLKGQVRQTMFQSMNRETKPNKTEAYNPKQEVKQNARQDVRDNIKQNYLEEFRQDVRENVRENVKENGRENMRQQSRQNIRQNVYPQESDHQPNETGEWQDPRLTPNRPQQPFFRSTVETTPPAPSAFLLPQKPATSNQKNANRFTFSEKDPIYEPSQKSQEQPKSKGFNWNTEFYRQNANQIEVLRAFRKEAERLTLLIIDDMTKKDRKYPSTIRGRTQIIQHQGITLVAASHQVNLGRQGVKYDTYAIQALINQFTNYNYILDVTAGESQIKVPLCCLTEYKGIVCLVKADIDTECQISPAQLSSELTRLERQTKINRSVFNHNGIFKQSYSNKAIYIDELYHFIPLDTWQNNRPYNSQAIQNSSAILTSDHQKQTNSRIQDRPTQKATNELEQVHEAVKESADRLLNWLEDFTVSVLSHEDIKSEFKRNWLTSEYLPYMYDATSVMLLKQYFASQMAALVAQTLYRNHMQNQIQDISNNKIKIRDSEVELFLIQQAYNFINQICSAENESLGMWKIIQTEIGNRYGASVGQDDISVGYFLSSFLDKVGLRFNWNDFSTKYRYFQQKQTIIRTFIQAFKIKTKSYSYSYLDSFRKLNQLLSQQPSSEGLDTLVETLNLIEDTFAEDTPQLQELKIYMANFIPPDFIQSKQFTHLGLYDDINLLPPSAYSIKLMLMACKWAVKLKQETKAFELFEKATEDIAFWGGQYHPLQTEFFDFFSQVHLTIGEYDQAIDLAKSSLVNTIKVVGAGRLPVAEKFYQLGNCFFRAGRKQDALTNYVKTKDLLQANRKNQSKQFGLVLMKIVTLELNLGHINQAVEYGLTCLGIFERQPSSQRQLVESLELLARAYEITQKSDRLTQLTSLCSERLKNCDDPKIFQRMLKVAVYPELTDLPPNTVKQLLYLVEQLSEIRPSSSHNKAFNYILKRAKRQNICQTLVSYIDRLDRLFNEISQGQLLRKYKGFDDVARTDAHDFICLFDAVVCLIDDSYVIGILTEYEY